MNKQDIESIQILYEELDHHTINSLIAVVLKSFDKEDYNQALKDIEGLKGFKVNGKSIMDMEGHAETIAGLEAKIMDAIANKEESDTNANLEEKKERNINTILERAKAGIFTYAQLSYMNDWADDGKQYKILALHHEWQAKEPSKHDVKTIPQGRAINDYVCKCGFEYGVDSSD